MTHVAAGNKLGRSSDTEPAGHASLLRQMFDSLICLALAVILFRCFEVEGYMISTGSMAPSLLGYHKRVACPTCGRHFAYGVAWDSSVSSDRIANGTPSDSRPADMQGPLSTPASGERAVCPNCGQDSIAIDDVPRNQGDQLLVLKHAYTFADPQRWEVVVFRNPFDLTQAYVKRIVALPDETIEIRHGDVYADGKIQRKNLESQRAVRIEVFDHDLEPPEDGDWRPRWLPVAASAAQPDWRAVPGGFFLDGLRAKPSADRPPTDPEPAPLPSPSAPRSGDAWSEVVYQHTVRHGGRHLTRVPLAVAPLGVPVDSVLPVPLKYLPDSQELIASGVFDHDEYLRLRSANTSAEIQTALDELYEASHVAPVTDHYGYNHRVNGLSETPVRDLMVELEVAFDRGAGEFFLEMTDGQETFRSVIDRQTRSVRLYRSGDDEVLRDATLSMEEMQQPLLLEMSLFDRQVLLAVNGRMVFAPWPLRDLDDDSPEPPRRPVRFGARNLRVSVHDLKLYRDVYYTPKGDGRPFQLGDDEYYVLGDNSPVSADSRIWPYPAVPRRLLLGKPFVVHLPSRPAELRIGRWKTHIRVPDFPRIRWIR